MQKTKIVFLVLPHVHLMDLAGPDQVFLEAQSYDTPLEIEYCSSADHLQTSAGLPFGKLTHFSKIVINPGDYLFVPGASLSYLLSKEFKNNSSLFIWIDRCKERGVKICSICSGAFVLGYTGLLDGRKCTTHWKRTGELQQLFPRAQVIQNILFIEDDGVYTSAGIASGIDMALHILEQMKGSYVAHKVSREMVIYSRRTGNDKQQNELLSFRNHIHVGIHNVQDWLQENLHQSPSLSRLAAIANMSERNFTRVFKKETSVTVNTYINLLRKEKIAKLIRNPDVPKSIIARECGLASERHVNRILQKKLV